MHPTDADRTYELGRVASDLLHDLAADLDTLSGWAITVSEGVRRNQSSPSDSQRLVEDAQRVGRLVSDVLGWIAYPERSSRARPVAAIQQLVPWLQQAEGVVPINLDVRLVDPAVEINGPASFFERAAANLIRNAVRHARECVAVSLHTRPEGARQGIVLRVEDDGPGVSSEVAGQLFTRLARGEPTGHGLGLSATAWLVSRLGGTAPAAGTSGLGGACFEIWLPFASEPPRAQHLLQMGEGRPVIGILDDDPAVRRVVVRFVEAAGGVPEVLPASAAAIEELLDGGYPIDGLLLDRNLGFADGYRVWLKLRESQPTLAARTALLTGGLLPAEQAAEEIHLISKPVSSIQLREWVQSLSGAGRLTLP